MKRSLFMVLAVLGVTGYFTACAMAADSEGSGCSTTSSDPVKEVVMAAPNAVAAGTEAAAPAVSDTVKAVATPVADAASAATAPLTGSEEAK
ncbi:MAG: hypothetical protein WC522_04095 [Candidatus Omnitrophota bacterium]